MENYQPIRKLDNLSHLDAKNSTKKRDTSKDYKAYTFGSDFYKSIHFH